MQATAKESFPLSHDAPRKPWISEKLWQILLEKRTTRVALQHIACVRNKLWTALCFSAWSGSRRGQAWLPVDRNSFNDAVNMNNLQCAYNLKMQALLHVQASKVKKLDSAANVTNISLEASKAAEAYNTRQLHECRRKLYGGHKKPPQMVKLADGSFAQTLLHARLRWKEFSP